MKSTRLRLQLGFVIAALGVGATLLSFQNCSQSARLSLKSDTPSETLFSTTLTTNFCTGNSALGVDTLNVIFVVDMSGSNVTCTPNHLGVGASSLPTFCRDHARSPTPPGAGPPGTDLLKDRMTQIRTFLSSACVTANPNNRFAVVGFSDLAVSTGAGCDKDLLKNAIDVLPQVRNLEDMQTTYTNWWYQTYVPGWNSGSPPAFTPTGRDMRGTVYSEGLNCAKSIIGSKVQSLNNAADRPKLGQNAYLIFFLTDGLARDKLNGTVVDEPGTEAMIKTSIRSIRDFEANQLAQSTQIYPVFYGASGLSAGDLTKATSLMTMMAQEGGAADYQVKNSVAGVNFCELLSSGRQSRKEMLRFGVVNLTAKMVRGRLEADSDMDGLIDSEETALTGYNAAAARTDHVRTEVLDGLCPRGKTYADCPVINLCTNSTNAMGLTSCDVEMFSPPKPDGLDSDRDGIPDLIEIIKGSRPNTDDRNSDNDGDGFTTLEEIQLGRDPSFNEGNIDPKKLISYDHSALSAPIPNYCTLEERPYRLVVNNMPLVRTRAVNQSVDVNDPNADYILMRYYGDLPWYNHAKDENVILVYYIIGKALEAANSNIPPTLVGRFFFVNAITGIVRPVPGYSDFRTLGTLDGIHANAQPLTAP